MLNFLYPLGIYRNIFPRNSSIRLKHHHHVVSAFRSYHVLQFHRLNLLRNFVINFGLVAFISDGYKPFDKNIKSIRYSLSHFDTACLVKKDTIGRRYVFRCFKVVTVFSRLNAGPLINARYSKRKYGTLHQHKISEEGRLAQVSAICFFFFLKENKCLGIAILFSFTYKNNYSHHDG